MRDLDALIVPGLTHWQSAARFFAYFKPHSAYAAVLGPFDLYSQEIQRN